MITRKMAYYSTIALLSVAIVEIFLHATYYLLNGHIYKYATSQTTIENSIVNVQQEIGGELISGGDFEVIHPYLGYVHDPTKQKGNSNLGFPGSTDGLFTKKSPDTVNVVFLGGSFAQVISNTPNRPILNSVLQKNGINPMFFTLAMGGYKQPQQLMTLAYILSHEAKVDIVINIDGFNEVALPQAENLPHGVNPFFPRNWYQRTQQIPDQFTLGLIGQISYLTSRRQEIEKRMTGISTYSLTVNTLWKTSDKWFDYQISKLSSSLKDQQSSSNRFMTTGPDLGSYDKLYSDIASHWKSCSHLINDLCKSRGIIYIHLLQPNQYYEVGKKLSDEERTIAFRDDHPYRYGVINGYPKLVEAGKLLIGEGVDFQDITMIYQDIGETIYKDDCCHPNQKGKDIVGEYIAKTIVERLSDSKR